MRLIILESPYAGDISRNVPYAKRAMLHSLSLGEAPIASHLLYPLVLSDDIPSERTRGIAAGLAWRKVTEAAVFYVDHGWSPGMRAAEEIYERLGIPYDVRTIL